jgi:hypothetical protein
MPTKHGTPTAPSDPRSDEIESRTDESVQLLLGLVDIDAAVGASWVLAILSVRYGERAAAV